MRARGLRAAAAIAFALLPAAAGAHGTVKGLGTFFSGVVHPLLEPAHLVSMIALGLLIGQWPEGQEPPGVRPAFAAALLVGAVAAGVGVPLATDVVLLVAAMLAGLLVVLAVRPPWLACAALGVTIGAGIGLGSRPDVATTREMVITLAGAVIGAASWTLAVTILTQTAQASWARILVRVVGSWMAASAILVLSLVLSGRPLPGSSAQSSPDRAGSSVNHQPAGPDLAAARPPS